MRRTGLLLALLFHGGWTVDNQGCESDVDCAAGMWCDTTVVPVPAGKVARRCYVASERYRSEESPPQNVVLATVAYPFKAAAGLFMPAPQRRQSDGDLSPMTASSRPVSRAHRANTSTTTMNSPPPAPRMLDDHELPRPPIARNERGLGSTWSDA